MLKNTDLGNVSLFNKAALVDLRDITMDETLPQGERIADYIRQIKDPNHYRVGDVTVRLCFVNEGISLREAVRQYLTIIKDYA